MLEKIADILKDYKGDDTLKITEQTTFLELAFDSLDTLQLITQIEDEFGVTIELEESMKTIGDLIRIIESVK